MNKFLLIDGADDNEIIVLTDKSYQEMKELVAEWITHFHEHGDEYMTEFLERKGIEYMYVDDLEFIKF